MQREKNPLIDESKVLSRSDYQEILLARMAGGDLYANEARLKIRRADMLLDKFRIAVGDKPIYTNIRKQ